MLTQESQTKYRLSEALKTLMRKKPLDQIRVREVTEQCGLRRQSFYYHFTDVSDLFEWSVGQERELLLQRQENCLTWQQAMGDLLCRMEEERDYYQAILKARGYQGLRQTLGGALESMTKKAGSYYRLRNGETLSEEEATLQLQCSTTVLLALLNGWICEELPHAPRAVSELMDKQMRQMSMGGVWQNLPLWYTA